MENKQFERLMNVLYGASAVLVLLGVFFKLQHYPIGNLLLWIGLAGGFIISRIEVKQLKKFINEMKDKEIKG